MVEIVSIDEGHHPGLGHLESVHKKPAAQATGALGVYPLGIFRYRRVTGPGSKLTGD
jgi:hypothetical protein